MWIRVGGYDHLNNDGVSMPIEPMFEAIRKSNYGVLRFLHYLIKHGETSNASSLDAERARQLRRFLDETNFV